MALPLPLSDTTAESPFDGLRAHHTWFHSALAEPSNDLQTSLWEVV